MSKIEYFHHVQNEIDKFRHLACIQKNRTAVAYDCRDVAIILRQLKFIKSQRTNTFHNERKSFQTDVRSREQKEGQNQIMKFYASGNVH